MEKKQPKDELPKWFMITSKIAKHCLYGVTILFILLKLDWTTANINPVILGYTRIFLLLVSVPTFIFAGADIVQILGKIVDIISRIINAISNNNHNNDEHK